MSKKYFVQYYHKGLDGKIEEAISDRSIILLDGRNSLDSMINDGHNFNGKGRQLYDAFKIMEGDTFQGAVPLTVLIYKRDVVKDRIKELLELSGVNEIPDEILDLDDIKFKTAQYLWTEFGDTPVDDDGNIEEPFLNFGKGTDREDIWDWFEHEFDVSVAKDLMYNSSKIRSLGDFIDSDIGVKM